MRIRNKESDKAYHREYYIKNRKKALEESKRWREQNHEKKIAYDKKYSKEHRKEDNARKKKYNKEHPEKVKERGKRYRKLHPEKDHEYRRKHPEKIHLIDRKANLKSKFGISIQTYNDNLSAQNNCCAICGKHQDQQKRAFAVDHDHETGKTRGILCNICNLGIGRFKDDITLLQKAIDYLTKYK